MVKTVVLMFSGLLIQKYKVYKFGVGIDNKIARQ
nr:MAG TPA: hypothetical protein [Caudoviricetes sp.]